MSTETSTAGERLLDYAHSRLVAVFDVPTAAEAAGNELTAAGFASSYDVLCGVAGADGIDFAGTTHGALGRLSHALHELTVEGAHMKHYERELQLGHCLIVVRTTDAAQGTRALDILKAHEGHFINQFGLWTVETVQP